MALTALKTLAFLVILCIFSSAKSWAEAPESVDTPAPVEHELAETSPPLDKPTLIAVIAPEFRVSLDGQSVTTDVSKDGNGKYYVRAEPILKALNDEFEYDSEESVLIVKRSQDGAIMELYTETGVVKANGRTLGKLAHFGLVSEDEINLTPNAIAVMSGAMGKLNAGEKIINFKLDPRLKVATGFEMFVNDIPLGHVDVEPKSIGPILLLPLLPIAEELGHDVRVIDGGSTVLVTRSQDSVEFELSLETGLVKIDGRAIGVTKNVTYFDKTNLLLPISAIETLTGTHINVEAGNARININLDSRLKNTIKAGERIDDVTKSTPLTLETLDFHIGTDSNNTVNLDLRYKGFNGRIRYEISDIPTNIREAEPSWLSLDYSHVKGGYGSIGDYSADLREFDGVGIRRVRGGSFVKETKKGRIAIAAGAPVVGSKKVGNGSRQIFGGAAAGVRYASKKGWEAGLSYKADGLTSDQMVVLSAISGRLGRKRGKKLNWDARADIGGFSGPARAKTLDIRTSVNARYEVNKNINVDVFTSYDGSEFLRSNLDEEQRREDINKELNPNATPVAPTIPDIRTRGQDTAEFGSGVQIASHKNIGPFINPAVSAQASRRQSGVLIGSEAKSSLNRVGASFNTQLKKIGTNVNVNWSLYGQNLADGSKNQGNQVDIRVLQDTKYVNLQGQLSISNSTNANKIKRLSLQARAKTISLDLPKSAHLSINPSLAGSWSTASNYVRAGVTGGFDSGNLLGKKTQLNANLGILQSFSKAEEENKFDKFLNVSLSRKLRINKNMQIGLSYRDNLEGNRQLGVFLDGRFGFNPKRKFKKSKEGRGVLKGRAFLDKNRDGIRQDNEPGIGGVLIRVKNTRLALRTDQDGYYTIQNIRFGIRELQVDGRSLPLGYSLADNVSTKASIREGYITDVALPIVHRGQIRGFAFVDEDGDGVHSKGETRLEGARLQLTSLQNTNKTYTAFATSFGQFAFDDLPSGKYEIQIIKTYSEQSSPTPPVPIELVEADDLMAKINVAAISVLTAQEADKNSNASQSIGVKGHKGEVPAPDIIPKSRGDDPAP
jgi:hypothetical protein